MILGAATHVIVDNSPDPNAAEGVRAAWATYDLTKDAFIVAAVAVIIAFIALTVALADARNNAIQMRMLVEERLRKPKLTLLWDSGDAFEEIDAEADQIFGDYCALTQGVRIQNSGNLAAHDITVILYIPANARTNSQMPRPDQMRLGLPDFARVSEMHAHGVFAHDKRSVDPDGRRHDDWDLKSVKSSGAFIAFAALYVLVPRGRSTFQWIVYCEEAEAETGTLEVDVRFPH